jgi:chemotaxis protein CheX
MNATYESTIEQIAQSIFATMLNMELVRLDEPASDDSGTLLATIHIAGGWTGNVVLALSPGLARASAAAMFRLPAQEVTDADQHEVAAELANMLGGNLKSVLPGPSFLSLPTIITGRDLVVQVNNAERIEDVQLLSEAGPLRVRLYAQLAPKTS